MAWKGVHISRPARLSYKDTQLVVAQDEGEVVMPVEDVAWILLDSNQVTLTASLVSACMEAGVAIIFSDARHTPSGMTLPFHRHHRQSAIAALQMGLTMPLKKRLWQALVIAKIENQSTCLATCGKSSDSVSAMAKLVVSGDPENVEARAAREYWSLLFRDFIRGNEGDLRNKMLNYGYAVVRAAIARALVASGLLPCFGLFHDSAANAFNLADDLFEPFRPLVDAKVFAMSEAGTKGDGELTVEHRRALAGILNDDTRLTDETVSVLIATERAAESLVRAMEGSSPALLCLPRL
ncbi:MAG: type II CRISPR-associated endonuclease Cas1 [Aestuariivirga sp.]